MSERTALLLYDGTCGFCARTVQFVLRHERRQRTLQFASLQSTTGREIRGRHPELSDVDSVIWYEPAANGNNERLLVRSEAALRVCQYLGGVWRGVSWLVVVPRPVRDGVYDFVARHRHRIAPGAQMCVLPSPEERGRFVD